MSDSTESDAERGSTDTDTTRREVLSAVGGVSMVAPLATSTNVSRGGNNPASDRVEYVERLKHTNPVEVRRDGAAPERTQVTDTVSRDHWLVVETAHDARDRVQELIEQHTTDPLVMTGVTTITDGGQSKKAVTVDRTVQKGADSESSPDVELDELKGIVPDTVAGSVDGTTIDGIPVITRERTEQKTNECDGYSFSGNYEEQIPGGSKYQTESCGSCTFGTAATDDETGNGRMITAGHCLNKDEVVRQPDCHGAEDGVTVQSSDIGKRDFASVTVPTTKSGEKLYYRQLADYNGTYHLGRTVRGIITESSLRYHEGDESYQIGKHGARTGRQYGYIKNIKTNSSGHRTVYTTNTTGVGDSGGPYYKEYQQTARFFETYIVGISIWGVGGNDCPYPESAGNTMEYVEEELGVTV